MQHFVWVHKSPSVVRPVAWDDEDANFRPAIVSLPSVHHCTCAMHRVLWLDVVSYSSELYGW